MTNSVNVVEESQHKSRVYADALGDLEKTPRYPQGDLYSNYEIFEWIYCRDNQCSFQSMDVIEPIKSTKYVNNKDTFVKLKDLQKEHSDSSVSNMKLEVLNKIGKGRYSDVYKAIDVSTDKYYVIKFLKPIKRKRIFREILILNNLNLKNEYVKVTKFIDVNFNYYNHDNTLVRKYYMKKHNGINNVILLDHHEISNSDQYKLIFESAVDSDFKNLNFTKIKLKKYTWELLKGLDYIHSMGIMHRDIKPYNVCYDFDKDVIKIIDFGLAEFYYPLAEHNVRVASRVYKSPELLVNYKKYDYSLDLWSLGCILAALVFQKDPFFHGKDNNDQLLKIIKILGTDDLFSYMEKYGVRLQGEIKQMVQDFPYYPKKSWRKLAVEKCNKELFDSDFVDFIDGLLCYDHQYRLTAREAMMMPWLDAVRE
ncbi:hypothetical protein FOG51_03125 [Hanseniaspora uvarum]|nr:hypothetical protein FOG51_03125 [Hanseniaspora uvarum]